MGVLFIEYDGSNDRVRFVFLLWLLMDLFDVDIDSALAINELSILQILERRHVILFQKNVEAE